MALTAQALWTYIHTGSFTDFHVHGLTVVAGDAILVGRRLDVVFEIRGADETATSRVVVFNFGPTSIHAIAGDRYHTCVEYDPAPEQFLRRFVEDDVHHGIFTAAILAAA